MDELLIFALKLLVSTYKISSKIRPSLPDDVVISIKEIEKNSDWVQDSNEEALSRFKLISKKDFHEKHKLSELRESLEDAKVALIEIFSELPTNSGDEIAHSDASFGKLKRVYENYIDQTHQVKEKPLIYYHYNSKVLDEIMAKLNVIFMGILKFRAAKHVARELKFFDRYNPENKITGNTVYEAVRIELEKAWPITFDELFEVIINKYHFSHYEMKYDLDDKGDRKKALTNRRKNIKRAYNYHLEKWGLRKIK